MKLCPDCGQELRQRQGKTGKFWGCSGYPECRYTLNIEEVSEPIPTPKPILPKKPTDEYVEGKKENTALMCRTNLMVAIVNKWNETTTTDVIKMVFNDLWDEVDK